MSDSVSPLESKAAPLTTTHITGDTVLPSATSSDLQGPDQTLASSLHAPMPAPPPQPQGTAATTSFASVTMRPPGSRYGDGDLIPGGGGGGMLMDERAFQPRFGHERGGVGPSADDFARFDPIFPGQQRPAPQWPGMGAPDGRRPPFPGEPDPDHLMPLQGGPYGSFGGPGGGQFGPRRGGFGGPG